MSENYTAEYFAQATLATRGKYNYARRIASDGPEPWRDGGGIWLSDAQLAAEGWTPVVESRITEHTLRDSQEKAARKRERLVDHIADQDRVIRRRNDEITALRRELADAQAPLSLDTLAAAWEAAEVPTDDAPIREGDVVIYTSACGTGVTAHKAAVGRFGRETHGYVRILSRAPKPREPWADLADVLADMGHLSPTGHAKALYERGVRISKNGRE